MTRRRSGPYLALGSLAMVALVTLTLLHVSGRGTSKRAAGLSCASSGSSSAVPGPSVGPQSDGGVPLHPPSPVIFMQAVVLLNDGKVAVTVTCGGRARRQLAPGGTLRFSLDEEVPVVLTDGSGRRCLLVGPRTPGGLGGLQPDGSQFLRTGQGAFC